MRTHAVRWLTRPSRVPRSLRIALALVLCTYVVVGLATPASSGDSGLVLGAGSRPAAGLNGPSKSPKPPGAGNPTKTFPDSSILAAEGFNLYQSSCSSCHGIALQGQSGVAPSLIGVGAGPVDFYLSTGRMPLANPRAEPERATARFNRSQINAVIDYVLSFGGSAAPTANALAGDLATGQQQFTLHCAGCHQIAGRGGITVGAQVPALQQATAQQVAEAVRMGPYLMPNFDAHQINQHQLDSIARYVLYTRHPVNAGGWSIGNIGPIPEGIVAWFVALLALVIVARLIGERTHVSTVSLPTEAEY